MSGRSLADHLVRDVEIAEAGVLRVGEHRVAAYRRSDAGKRGRFVGASSQP